MPTEHPEAIVLRGFLSAAERAEILSCAPGATWETGRQGTGYQKRALAWDGRAARAEAAILGGAGGGAVLERDHWLLWYPAGVGIPAHVDPVGAGAHWRLNVVLAGGPGAARAFFLEGATELEAELAGLAVGDAVIFRSDAWAHGVRAGSERWAWSVGCRIGRDGGNGV